MTFATIPAATTIAMDLGASAGVVNAVASAGGTLSAIGSIASIASTGIGAFGAIKSGQASAASARYNAAVTADNAQIQKNNASLAAQAGEAQAGMSEMKTRATVGAIAANQAAAGIDVGSGSALDVRSSARELGELDAINIRSNAARTAYGYQVQSSSDTSQSQLDRFQAGQDSTAGFVNAGSTILGGVGNTSLNYAKYLQAE